MMMNALKLQGDSGWLGNSSIIDRKLGLQDLLNGVVREVLSRLDLLGCRAVIFKEEDGECEVTATAGRLPHILEAQDACSALAQDEAAGDYSSKTARFIPISLCSTDRALGLLWIYPFQERPITMQELDMLHFFGQFLAELIQGIRRYAMTQEKGETLMSDVWRWFKTPTARDGIMGGNHLSPPFLCHRPMYL
jgi:hypothetical protein